MPDIDKTIVDSAVAKEQALATKYGYVALGKNSSGPDGLPINEAIELMESFGPKDEELAEWAIANEPKI